MRKHIITFLLLITSQHILAQDKIKIDGIPRPLEWSNRPTTFTNQNTMFTIGAGEKTDMFRDPNGTYNTDNAPRLLFQPDDNFVISCSIEHAFTHKWDAGAILLQADSMNWIKFCFEKDYTGARRIVSVVTKEYSDDCNSVELKTNKIFLRMAKADKAVTLYYSENEKDWFLIRNLRFEAGSKVKVGFLAQSPDGKGTSVKFSNVSYQARKIKDPYSPE